jgi:hypothetical protein
LSRESGAAYVMKPFDEIDATKKFGILHQRVVCVETLLCFECTLFFSLVPQHHRVTEGE